MGIFYVGRIYWKLGVWENKTLGNAVPQTPCPSPWRQGLQMNCNLARKGIGVVRQSRDASLFALDSRGVYRQKHHAMQ